MSNLNTLFDFSKCEKRKPLGQQQFEDSNRQLLTDFKNFVPQCFERIHKQILPLIEPIDQGNNLQSELMSGFLKGQFIRKYPLLCYKATKQRFRLFVDNTNIYIKKLDEKKKLPSNIPTNESLMILNNLTDSATDTDTNIFLGYTTPADKSKITGIYAVCIEGDDVIWCSDLSNFGEGEQSPVITMIPKPIMPKIKPGAKKRNTKNE